MQLKNNANKKMSYVLPQLKTKKEVDEAIKGSEDRVVVLRFGREQDAVCLQLDDIVRPSSSTQAPFFACGWYQHTACQESALGVAHG